MLLPTEGEARAQWAQWGGMLTLGQKVNVSKYVNLWLNGKRIISWAQKTLDEPFIFNGLDFTAILISNFSIFEEKVSGQLAVLPKLLNLTLYVLFGHT